MVLNKLTYDALPYGYIAAGVMNAMLLDSGLKYLPVIVLIAAGLLVLAFRRSARVRQRLDKDRSRVIRRLRTSRV